jgi:hypothetical protein
MEQPLPDLSVVGIKVLEAKVKVYKLGFNYIQVEVGSQQWTTRLVRGTRPKWNSFHIFSECEGDKVFFTLYEKHDLDSTEIAFCELFLRDVYGKKCITKTLVSGIDNKGTLRLEFVWNKETERPGKSGKRLELSEGLPSSRSHLPPSSLNTPRSLLITQPRPPKSLMAIWRDERAAEIIKTIDKSTDKPTPRSRLRTPTSRGHTTQFVSSKRLTKGTCAGDFCMYILTGASTKDHADEDYDEIVNQAKAAYIGDGAKDAYYFKLEMQLEYLKSAKDKARVSQIRNFVSFMMLFRGKQILTRAGLLTRPAIDMELDVDRLMRSIETPETDAKDRAELALKAQEFPYFCYEQAAVCDRCYAVYTHLRHQLKVRQHKQAKLKQLQHAPLSSPASSPLLRSRLGRETAAKKTKDVFLHLLSPSITTKTNKDQFFISPIGKVNKNDLGDLLTDIQSELNPGLTGYYRTLTQDSKSRKMQQVQNVQSITYTPVPYIDDLAQSSQQFFALNAMNPIKKDFSREGSKTTRTRLSPRF